MGLKGKIEAIIYAAEEPVSLDHIALLVKEPVLQELAEEQARAEAAQATAEAEVSSDTTEPAQSEPTRHALPTEMTSSESAEVQPEQPAAPQVDGCETETANESLAQAQGESVEAPAAEQPQATEPGVAVEGPVSEAPATSDASSEVAATEPEPPTGVAGSEQPLPEASEKAKATVASKRKAKAEIPPEVRAKVRATLEELIADYTNPDRGMEIRQIAGGYRMTTKPEHHDVVKAFAKSLKPPLRLSLPALETLAVIAYKQPVTAPEVGEIRGVDSQGVVATLLDRKLITTAGRKAVIGRPILYKTTKEFLMRFGLNEISELPSMEEFEKLALEAGQVDMFESSDAGEGAPPADDSASREPSEDSRDTERDVADVTVAESSPDAEHASAEPSEPAQVLDAGSQGQESDSSGENEPAQSQEPVH